MADVTALDLVNRLLVRLKYDEVANFTAENAALALELVNTSMRELIASRDYPWNVRSDGTLTLKAPITGTGTLTISSGTLDQGIITSFTSGITSVTGQFSTRMRVTSSTTHSDIAMNVTDAINVGSILTVNFSEDFPGGAVAAGDYKFFFSEYLLPDRVGKVLSVRNQGEPMRLVEVDPHSGFDEWMPRPHDTEDSEPRVIAVGGTAIGTYDSSSASEGDRRLRLMVWPVPTEAVMLNYSFKERLINMTSETNTRWAPREFWDDVIERAEAKAYSGAWQNDPGLAQILFQHSRIAAQEKYANSRLDPHRRHSVRPLDAGGGRKIDTTKYRDIGSL